MRHGNAEGLETPEEKTLSPFDIPTRDGPERRLVMMGEQSVQVTPTFYLDTERGEWMLTLQCRFPADRHHQSAAWALAAQTVAAVQDLIAGDEGGLRDLPDMVLRNLDETDDG